MDCSGNQSATVSQTISIVDNTPPTIGAAGPDYTLECGDPIVFTPPTANDACDAAPSVILVSDVTSSGSCPGSYTRTKTWKAIDCSGNQSASVSQTLTIVDNTAPLIGSPGPNMTINCPANPVFTPPTATDACDPYVNILLVSDVTLPGSCPGIYSRTRTWKAVDCSGNQSATVSQTITVVDNTAPVIGSPGANATINCPATPVFTAPTASDACDPSVQVVLVSDNTIPGSCPGVYSRTRIWKAVDCSGNQSATVSQTINVVDNTAPTISSAGPNQTLQCPTSPVFTPPTTSDLCDPSASVVLVSDITTPGPCPGVYSRTRTWKAVDCSGNQSPTVSQTINVIDNTPPSIGPAGPNMTVACTTSVNFTPPIATDLCDGNPGVVLVSEVTNNLSCPGGQVGAPYAVTRTWKAVDCSGNESGTVSQTITYDCCQEIYPPICLTSATKPDKVGGSIITTVSGDTITLRVTLAKTFVDNTYGTGAIGWPSGHTFSNLTGSDNLQLALLNKNGTKVLEFKMDYITSTSTSPSGYKSLGVTGGDGGMILGSATNIYSVVTSMDRNFNAFGYILTSNSPSTNAAYTPNPSYPSWIYDVWYEVKVKKSAFGAIGYGRPLVTSIHASPSKTGSNTEPVIECPLFSTSKTNEQCGLPCSGSIDVTTTSGLAPYTYLWSDGNIGEDRNNLCPGTYTVTVTDAAGSVASSTVTILAAPAPPCNVNEVCFASPTKPNIVNAKSTWTISGDTITIRTTLAKTFVDNTYGTNIIGWPSAHKFGDLTGSDNLQLALYNANGAKVTEFKMDYISSSSTVPSGFRCLGVTGGEGKMLLGSASNIYSVTTSIDRNFNQFGYVLTTNSPATNASYAPNATYPSWIYEVWYEVKVNKNAFGTIGFGYPKISGVHASPSKTGSNSEPVDSVPCVPGIPARLSDQNADIESLSLMLYPNPANDVVKLTFNGIESGPVLITLTAMDGKVMDMIYRGNIEAGQVYQVEYGTAHLAAGLYILNFKSEGMTESQRLMIVHQ